jgi:trehalose/maltose transport system substrate-binding protein
LGFSAAAAEKKFIDGEAIFYLGRAGTLFVCNQHQVDIAPIPAGPSGRVGVGCLWGKNLYINPGAHDQKAAFKLAWFLAGEEAQKLAAVRAGRVPSRKSVFRDVEVIEKNPYFPGLAPFLSSSRPLPGFLAGPSALQGLADEYHRALKKEVVR